MSPQDSRDTRISLWKGCLFRGLSRYWTYVLELIPNGPWPAELTANPEGRFSRTLMGQAVCGRFGRPFGTRPLVAETQR
jgi:hypothetical protein